MKPALALGRIGLAETGSRGGRPCGLDKANRDMCPGRAWQARRTVISENSLRSSFQTQVSTTRALPTSWSVVPYVSRCLSHKQVHISTPYLYFYPAHHTAISQRRLTKWKNPCCPFQLRTPLKLKKSTGQNCTVRSATCCLRC